MRLWGNLLNNRFPISMEEVAAGEGALQTWTEFPPWTIKKSSTSLPSFIRAWARTPAWVGMRSACIWESACAMYKGCLTEGAIISWMPSSACFAASFQKPVGHDFQKISQVEVGLLVAFPLEAKDCIRSCMHTPINHASEGPQEGKSGFGTG